MRMIENHSHFFHQTNRMDKKSDNIYLQKANVRECPFRENDGFQMTSQSIARHEEVDPNRVPIIERPRILLIDDEVDNIHLLKQIFQLKV